MDSIELEERITDLLVTTFLPKDFVENREEPMFKILRSGMKRDVTENILRLVEDYYTEHYAGKETDG